MAVTNTLNTERRRSALVSQLTEAGSLLVNDVAREWGVHAMTVRRDFDLLVNRGIARRVRGGILAVQGDSFTHRKQMNSSAKETIATKLVEFVSAGSVLALDSSTTISVFTEAVTSFVDTTVITNGLPAFQTLRPHEGIQVFLTGGEQEVQNDSLIGPLAEAALSHFLIDTAFMSTMRLSHKLGTSENTLAQVSFKRALSAASQRLVLAVDSSKLETQARFRSLDINGIDVLVTELEPNDTRLDPYRDLVQIIR